MYLINLAVCKHYDGIIWPEIHDSTALGIVTKPRKWNFFGLFKSRKDTVMFGSEQFVDIKSLSQSDHVNLRKMALAFYLNGFQDILCGIARIDDPVQVVRIVYGMFASLDNGYVYYDNHETDWKFEETAEVCYKFYTIHVLIVCSL